MDKLEQEIVEENGAAEERFEDIYELAPLQEGMLFHALYTPESTAYNVQLSFSMEGKIDHSLVQRAWCALVERHAVLRTSFIWDDLEKPFQIVHQRAELPFEHHDLRGLESAQQELQKKAIVDENRAQVFDLAVAPLMRFSLIRFSDTEYQLVWAFHHIILEGWSAAILSNEFWTVYYAYANGTQPQLAPARPYADYIRWLQMQDRQQAESYWRGMLKGFRSPTPLPMQRFLAKSPAKVVTVELEELTLPKELGDKLHNVARNHRLTLNTLVQAVWSLLLGRYSDQHDIVFGAVVSGRPPDLEGSESMVGMFVNTLPARVRIPDDSSLMDWLQALQQSQVEMREFEYTSLLDVRGWCDIESSQVLFESLLGFENWFGGFADGDSDEGIKFQVVDWHHGSDQPLTLFALPGSLLKLLLMYDASSFDATDIKRMMGHLHMLLQEMVVNPQRCVSELSMLSEPERLLLTDWNQTSTDYPRNKTVHELFEIQAAAYPEAVAVAYGDSTLDYTQLNLRANQVAHFLQARGVGPEVMVGLHMERSVEMIVGLLGILKAGGAYVPLDLEYPQSRIAFMLEDAGIQVLLSMSSVCDGLPDFVGELLCLDSDWAAIEQESGDNPRSGATAENLAYVIYTSGSTGMPKGVEILHRSINRLVRDTDYYQIDATDRVAQASNVSFDAATFEIWGALLNGARLVGISKEELLNSRSLAAVLKEQAVSAMFLTTALFNQIAGEAPGAFKTLRCLMFGGEAVDPGAVRQVLASDPPERLLHVYGPTESTTFASWYLIDEVSADATTVPIGRPLANTRLQVLDHYRNPVPVGVPGELYIGGDGLARGYLKRPELTAERFVADPLSQSGILYRTGDKVRYRRDGAIEFLGRFDHQVKLRGFRIEPGEIETVLAQHKGVQQALVVECGAEPDNKQLAAYILKVKDASPTVETLRQCVRASLPDYMMPAMFVLLDEFPLTPNGKVDRDALPLPSDLQEHLVKEYTPPRTDLELQLTRIWAEVLKVEQVGLHDDFFDLGGHSLKVTQVVSRIRQAMSVELPLSEMFEHPTVAELIPAVEILLDEVDADEVNAIVEVPRDGDLPLSFAQERLWFLDQLEPGSIAYNMPLAIRLKGELSVLALADSLNAIVRHQEALRTIFAERQGKPIQVIEDNFIELTQDDLSTLTAKTLDLEVKAQIDAEASLPFDLSAGPLLRCRLLRLSNQDHVLLLTMHHIIADGWSLGVLFNELGVCYSAFSEGEYPVLPELPIQYADFAAWQRQRLSDEKLEAQLTYWQQKLKGLSTLNLPTDRPRPAIQTYSGAQETLHLDADLIRQLTSLSRQTDVTLFMTLLAGFAVLMHRYSGQNDVVIGSPIANRNRVELEGLIGMFINMLVMRTQLSGTLCFRDLLAQVQETALEAYQHQDIPFEKLVEMLQPERDRSRNPLTQVQFALQNAPIEPLKLEGLSLEVAGSETHATRFDLECHVSSPDNEHYVVFVYNTDLFDASTIKRMLNHYRNLLQALVSQPEQSIDLVPMLSKDEKRLVVDEWNLTVTDYPRDKTVQELFEQQAAISPHAIAVEYQDATLSYAQLNERANQLAHFLRAQGVVAEVMVGLFLERGLDMIVALLGILKSGGAYVPLDLEYPKSRLAFMLEDAAVPILLTTSNLSEKLPAFAGERVCLDADWGEIAKASVDNPEVTVAADSLAYVIYTSGSTGTPKGVEIQHRAINRLVRNTDYYQVDATDRVAQASNVSFDAATFEVWGALLNGASLVGIDKDTFLDSNSLAAFLQQKRVTAMFITTAVFNQIARETPAAFAGLKALMFGGEAVDCDAVRAVLASQPPERLLHVYGPTESTTFASWYQIEEVAADATTVPIGRPLANTTLYVLDQNRSPVSVGVPGELYIGADGLARGYLNRSELTAERFVASPFDAVGTLYRTGDKVRYQADGAIEFMGRFDDQIKLRGFRIELGEIENALTQQAAVRDAAVIVVEDEAGDKRLIAYVVPTLEWIEQNSPVEDAEAADFPVGAQLHPELIPDLRQHMREQLPAYMMPSVFVVLDELQLNANGKVDRKALPMPADIRSGLETGYIAARNDIEEQLAQIWSEVLKLERVGIHDNFFDLGGHSLMATQVVSRTREQFSVELPVSEIFSCPTVAELVLVVESLMDENHGDETSTILTADREADLPLSFAQERLWFLDQLNPGSSAYIIPLALRLKGELRIDVLLDSLNAILARHETLRTRLVYRQGSPIQIIDEQVNFDLLQIDLSGLSVDARDRELTIQLEAESARPFDLATDTLIRGCLWHIADNEHVLLLTMHHIISDGWSLGVLFGELKTVYGALSVAESPELAKLPIQYADFAAWQRQWLTGEVLARQLDYWKAQLIDLPTMALPTDRPSPSVQTFAGSWEALLLDGALQEQLERLSKQAGASLFMTLLAAFAELLHRYCDQEDIVIGSPIANRNRFELEGLIGFFVNSLVMRTDVSGDPSFLELVERVNKMALGAFEHQDLPFEKLVEELHPVRDRSRNPLFQVQFSLQNAPMESIGLQGLTLEPLVLGLDTVRFDLTCNVQERLDGLEVTFIYNTDLFEAASIKRMLTHYKKLLTEIVAAPQAQLSTLPMLSESECYQLVEASNQTATTYQRDKTLHELFEAQVRATPEAEAVVYEGQSLTYRELNQRANHLSHYLRARGVGPEVMVGLCVERSLEMVVGILGILKAGGAYLPLDPEYPRPRLEFMLEDAGAPLILTQQELRETLPDNSGEMVCLDSDWELISQHPSKNPSLETTAENLAYVIYTSGSTGRPKGVMIQHRSVVNLANGLQGAIYSDDKTARYRVALNAPIAFDASIQQLVMLLYGHTLDILSQEVRQDPQVLVSYLKAHEIDVLDCVPTQLKQLLDTGFFDGSDRIPSIIMCGGEALDGNTWRRIGELAQTRVYNLYGPSECTVDSTICQVGNQLPQPAIGRPINNAQVLILDKSLQLVPVGVPGELHIGGDGLARGYLNRPELTAVKFIANPFSVDPEARLYKTGDLVRYRVDGSIEFLGRIDHQVKLRGFRIELGEIESALSSHARVRESVVLLREDKPGDKRLVAYVVAEESESRASTAMDLRAFVRTRLPGYMVPSTFMVLDRFPLSTNGKLDRQALPMPDGERQSDGAFVKPRSDLERQLVEIWMEVLAVDKVGIHDNFFDLGGHSLLLVQVHEKILTELESDFTILELFKYPTISMLATHLSGEGSTTYKSTRPIRDYGHTGEQLRPPIAIIGMAGRFPGASDVETFWSNLRDGVESVTFFSDDELRDSGIPDSLIMDPKFVNAASQLDDVDMFDARFFGYTPRQAQVIDPQQRFFLECAWEVMERAGYDAEQYQGHVGVYGGASVNEYSTILKYDADLAKSYNHFDTAMGRDRDYLATRVSYNLNLNGPGITLQTTCSTSLVATHMGIQGLQQRDCDMAIAGGTTIKNYQLKGYYCEEGGIMSPDGHCRAFDANANGTIGGDGSAVVLLKRLDDALADGDQIYAVIKGSAINNDGSHKTGYTAPSVQGQAQVITAAQEISGVDPGSISYIEAHGTGTALGDPIEIAALTEAFQRHTQDKNFCAIGSVKTNVGHLESASGVAGLIKTAMALWHKELPPSLHYQSPNPGIDFDNSPFFVNAELKPWEAGETARRAGVSSFGIGGTNAHIVLEEAPVIEASSEARPWQLLILSAKTATALDQMTLNLHDYLQYNPDVNLADLAFTLQVGRKAFNYRRAVVCQDVADAVAVLESRDPGRVMDSLAQETDNPVVFMFTGQGSQYANMGLHLYQYQSCFREVVDQCCEILLDHLDLDLRDVLFPSEADVAGATTRLNQTEVTQSALFVTEYALARLWMSWGITPSAMIGHSIGEYVAACLSDVVSLEAALELVATRGRLMGQLQKGSMLAVTIGEAELVPMLGEDIEIATINGLQMCVVSGADGAIDKFAAQLDKEGVLTQRLHTSHAFHSAMMEPVLEPFTEFVSKFTLNVPSIPYLSNVTGTWIKPADATRPQYYATHLRNPVRFSDGLEQIFAKPECLLVEVGPGHTLSALAKHHPDRQASHTIVSSLRHATEEQADEAIMWRAIAHLWLAGGHLDWASMHRDERRHRIRLPTYPFERQRFWIEQKNIDAGRAMAANRNLQTQVIERLRTALDQSLSKGGLPEVSLARQAVKDWFYVPSWKRSMSLKQKSADGDEGRWLIFCDNLGISEKIKHWLIPTSQEVTCVFTGNGFSRLENGDYTVEPGNDDNYRLLMENLQQKSRLPKHIVHLWAVTPAVDGGELSLFKHDPVVMCYHSLVYLTQALGRISSSDTVDINVISNNVHAVLNGDSLYPEKATLLGPCSVIGMEYPNMTCRNIEIGSSNQDKDIEALMAEILSPTSDMVVAYRDGQRWVKTYEPVMLNAANQQELPIKQGGVYLITGGLGGIGLSLATFLAQEFQARLVLTGRSDIPPRESWPGWLGKDNGEASSTSVRIKAIHALEELGSEVLALQADVVDKDRMREVFELAQQEFGEINGVIHSAGLPGGRVIQLQSAEIAAAVMAPKVDGTRIVGELCSTIPLDFMVLCSSLASLVSAAGQVDYCSSNAFQDAYADYFSARSGIPVVAINWDAWNESGMWVNTMQKLGRDISVFEGLGFNNSEGIEVFKRVLAHATSSQIAVSTFALSSIIPKRVIDIHSKSEAALESVSPEPTSLEKDIHELIRELADFEDIGTDEQLETDNDETATTTATSTATATATETASTGAFPRPVLSSDYVEPGTANERTLTEIWQQALGIDKVGINDNFFELGGDSVLNIEITATAKQAGLMLAPVDAFEHQTIAELAALATAKEQMEAERDTGPVDNSVASEEQDISEDDLAEILRQQEIPQKRPS